MTFSRYCIAAAVTLIWLSSPGASRAEDETPQAGLGRTPAIELSAQSRSRRARTRIQVYPRRYSYPGRNAKRDCVSWLEPEWRPSGSVIVPRLRCWWVPG